MGRRAPWNPNTADWLVKQRGSRTQDAVIADMAARGVKVKRAWLSRIENGAPFSDELLDAFRNYYGSEPPPYEPVETPATPPDALIAALNAQTEAMTNLVMEIRFAALSVLGSQEGSATLLADLVRLAAEGKLDELAPLLRPEPER